MNGPPPRAHGAGESRAPAAPHPPMADIVASAAQKVESLSRHSIRHLLEQGRMHFSTASAMLASRAPVAGAYWEYLVAYQIVVDLIPRHPDYYDRVDTSRSQTHRDFKLLVQDIKASEERFVRIKDIIKNDNKRNATAPRSPPRPETRSPSTLARRSDELMLPAMPATLPNGNLVAAPRKPPVQPKPQSLHGRAIHASLPSVNGINDLAQRFANLRGAPPPVESTSSPSTRSDQDPAFKMPVPADYASSMRPLGPRDMPLPPLHMPPYPSMLPLNTQFAASLPKEPSPTYSPARNISGPLSINPPRSTPRSMVGTGGRSNSLATSSSISSHAPNGNGTSDSYFPAQNGSRDAPARKTSVSKSVELEIDASKLYDFFRMFNVLLIDVRDRIDFDSGHIYVRNIMCIEPLSLRDGDSAEQLLDRLVLSPDEEQSMFDRRNEYDVVVYYDDSTPNAEFLHKHDRTETQLALKRLFDTLHEFNAEKPLKRPPVFLMGGLDAWVDLVGSQALRVSKTAGMAPGDDQRRPRTTRQSPAVSRAERSNLLKRRRREYVPMDPEEEQKWLEEARKGRMAVDLPAREENDDDELESPFYRSTEEFLRRYPEVEAEQSMMYPSTKFQSTNQYIAPAIPITPSRPPPAVPRVSYSGVHERQVSQQSRAQQASAHLSHSRYINVKLHKTGLLNFGVTCYMNSVVQCLSGSLSLSDLFLTQRYQRDLQRDNWKGTKGILPEAYATLLSNLYKGDVSCVRPSTFRRICGHFNSQWGVDQQQDAKEFLEFVLDYMHEDLNITWNKAPLKPLTDQQELQREQFPRQYAAKIEWGRYQHRDMSVIGGMFAGQHASQLTCQTCGVTSTTYEAFWSISVEIPRDGQCDVRDCLRSYCAPERLAGDEVWRCPRCKKDREAVKKITITRAPDTLVLHFKRFSASRTESARKVRTPVHFPLQGLDMAPFVEPPMTPAQEAYIAQNARDGPVQLASVKADPTMNGPYVYNAYAVIWHIGATLGSGHYIAFVKDKSRGSWRSFNDDKINEFDPGNLPPNGRLQNEKAYIVFYEREQVAGGASF